MKRWLAFLTALLIALCAIGPSSAVASDNFLLGDVDGDANISMKDALFMRKYIAHQGDLANPVAADVNGDQSVDMRDVLLLRKYIAYLIKAFPAAPAEPPLADLSSDVPVFRYGYDQLSSLEKAAYTETVDAIRANIGEDTNARDGALGLTVVFSKELPDENSVSCVFRAIYADHPELFFLCTHYSYSHTPEGTVTALLLHYSMNAIEREQAELELLQVVNDWVSALPADASDAEKEIALHDRLCDAVTYASSNNGVYADACYSPYGALINGRAVCDGYARALQLLLLAADVKSTVVEGFDANGAAHMWDVVYLAGEPYYVDPTWDDALDIPVHAYCNITTAEIAPSHTMNFWFPLPPTCTATKFNYYLLRGLYVTTTDGEDYSRLVIAARQSGAPFAEVRFSADTMTANRYLTESGHLCNMVNRLMPADVDPLPGYSYSFFDGVNVTFLSF